MKTEVVLHIGSHKTGTSFLQEWLFLNRAPLLKAGTLYPSLSATPFPTQHSTLAIQLRSGDKDSALRSIASVLAEAESLQCERVLLSGEEFFFLPSGAIASLGEALSGTTVRVLAYIRNTYDYVRAQVNQHMRFGNYPVSADSFAQRFGVYQPAQILRRWEAQFGEDAVRVLCYEEQREDLLSHFLEMAGVTQIANPKEVGAAAANRGIDFLCAWTLNQLLFAHSAQVKSKIYSRIAQDKRIRRFESFGEDQFARRILSLREVGIDHAKLRPFMKLLSALPNQPPERGHERARLGQLRLCLDHALQVLDQTSKSNA